MGLSQHNPDMGGPFPLASLIHPKTGVLKETDSRPSEETPGVSCPKPLLSAASGPGTRFGKPVAMTKYGLIWENLEQLSQRLRIPTYVLVGVVKKTALRMVLGPKWV